MLMKQLQKVFLVLIALLCLALFVSPALATPPAHRATWNWYGVSVVAGHNDPTHAEVDGSAIRLSGNAFQNPDDTWTGTGVFHDKNLAMKAKLGVQNVMYGPIDGTTVFLPSGVAEVTVNDVPMGTYRFALYVSDYGSGYPRGLDFTLFDYPTTGLSTGWTLTTSTGEGLSGGGLHYT